MGNFFKKGIIISFINQKGGVGKSTLTQIFANYLHTVGKEKGLKIAVIDSDDLQQTVLSKRNRELEESKNPEQEYRVLEYSSADLADNIEFLQQEYDIIIIDLPGNMKQPGVITSYFLIDVAIIPFEASVQDIDSTKKFYNLYKSQVVDIRKNSGFKTKVVGVLNKVNVQLKEVKEIQELESPLGFPMLKNYLRDLKVQYQRNLSTLESETKESDTLLCEEILQIINDSITE